MSTKKTKKVLVLGSGLVSRPGVTYLLNQDHLEVTVASNQPKIAASLVKGYKNGRSEFIDVKDREDGLPRLIKEHDIVVSLLPWVFHVQVAKLCLELHTHMVTTSYVSEGMRHQDEEARKKGLLFLNEIGVDPGLDHMSAMKIIDEVREEGGKIVRFYSFCGGLPAPQSNDNPFGYKFSWSPRGVILASKNPAKFLENGKMVEIPGDDLFVYHRSEEIEGLGTFEVYANRNSLPYRDLYGLKYAETVMRGTYRYPGWCATFKKIVDLGLVDATPAEHLDGITYAEMMAELTADGEGENLVEFIAGKLGIERDSAIMERLKWLGLFSDEEIPTLGNHLDVLSHRLQEKLYYKEGEIDMLLLKHKFTVENKDKSRDLITSTMVDYGIPHGDSSMSRTVSLPLAIGVRLIAEEKIDLTGIQIPITKQIYQPVLKELETLGIKLEEKRVHLK
jgi:saccharopine dehydrogenase (NADP+, L-glutamate forming)/spermidine synthase